MAHQHGNKRSRRSRAAAVRRRRLLGAGTTAGAFVAFGLSPLAHAPTARADELDVIIEPIVNAIAGSVSNVVDPLAGLESLAGADPLAGLDVGSLSLPAAEGADTGGVAAGSVDVGLASEALSGVGSSTDALSAASSSNDAAAVWFADDVYPVLHTDMENWITSPLGEQVDTFINQVAGQDLIGNGVNGTAAGSRWG